MSRPFESSLAEIFDGLFERHYSVTFSWLLGQTGDQETAADLLQETFVRVWRHIAECAQMDAEHRRAWIATIARNVLIDSRRRNSFRDRVAAVATEAPLSNPLDGPEQMAVAKQEHESLDRAIQELPENLRTVLVMSVIEEMSSEEIGRALCKPAGTVRSQLHLARKQLAKRMGIS